jgi:hypothetical protein
MYNAFDAVTGLQRVWMGGGCVASNGAQEGPYRCEPKPMDSMCWDRLHLLQDGLSKACVDMSCVVAVQWLAKLHGPAVYAAAGCP